MARQPYEGRLELTWTNKHLRLLAHEDDGYEWVSPSDYRVSEVRLLSDAGMVQPKGRAARASPDLVADLHERATSVAQTPRPGGDSPRGLSPRNPRRARANLLIRGDALNALTSLANIPEFADEYVGKIKLVYIDPPFNTQQAFPQYDDALEHSVWLTMMRDRLLLAKKLLAPDGCVWVHLDDAEMAYCRAMMDEVFGRQSFVATVVWEKADSPRNSARWFSTDHDYLLVYACDAERWRPNRLPRTEKANAIYANPDDDPRGPWLPGDPYANKPYSRGTYTLAGPTGRSFRPPPGRFWRVSREKFQALDRDSRIWWGPNGDARPSIKRYLSEVGDLVPRTLWRGDEVGSNRTSKNEIRRLFPRVEAFHTPKPEHLVRRVIEIGSNPGEIVLDYFLGSGTTAAVAHKMGRRWIGVEWSAETLDTYAIPRLTKVVEGRDPGGITESVGWEGGGGFRILDVGHSMFIEDGGNVVLAEWATNGRLAEVTAAQLHYDLEDDPPFIGRKGKTRLAVVDGLVNEDVVKLLIDALPPGERVIVAGTAVDPLAGGALRVSRPGSNVRKIPTSILRGYVDRARWAPAIAKAAAPSSVG